MKFNTFSVVVGTAACNAKCPFCVAKMTNGFTPNKERKPELTRLDIASRFAVMSGVNTALLTSRGEPTLFVNEITDYLRTLNKHFPLIELQTNGLALTMDNKWKGILPDWLYYGLTHVALSIVHYNNGKNGTIYTGIREYPDLRSTIREYPDLRSTIDFLVECGFSVRLNCIGLNGYIDTVEEVENLLSFARSTGHELQVTWRPVAIPSGCTNEVARVTKELQVEKSNVGQIVNWLENKHSLLYCLPHGAGIYDVDGQNFCIANCLTVQPEENVIRQLIFADGRLRYDWDKKGAIIL